MRLGWQHWIDLPLSKKPPPAAAHCTHTWENRHFLTAHHGIDCTPKGLVPSCLFPPGAKERRIRAGKKEKCGKMFGNL